MKVNVITDDGDFKTFYSELDEVKENLDYILSVKERRIKFLEEENTELKNNEYYEKLEAENKRLHKIISNSFIITEEESKKINNWKQKHIERCLGNEPMKIGALGGMFSYIFQPTSLGSLNECICNLCKQKIKFGGID